MSGAQCKPDPIDPEHLLVAAHVMNGDALASVQLQDPNSTSTIVRVSIAPGNALLTLLLHSHDGLIWDFEGATDRVRKAIADRFSQIPITRHRAPQSALSAQLPYHRSKFVCHLSYIIATIDASIKAALAQSK